MVTTYSIGERLNQIDVQYVSGPNTADLDEIVYRSLLGSMSRINEKYQRQCQVSKQNVTDREFRYSVVENNKTLGTLTLYRQYPTSISNTQFAQPGIIFLNGFFKHRKPTSDLARDFFLKYL
jgi:hypothetical protein